MKSAKKIIGIEKQARNPGTVEKKIANSDGWTNGMTGLEGMMGMMGLTGPT